MAFVAAAAAVAGAGMAVANGQKANKIAKQTAADNKAASEAQARQAEMDFNKVNAKKPSFDTAMNRTMMNAKNGGASTMLTGASGVATGTLGKSTLLGS